MKQDWLQERMFLGTSGVVDGDNARELFLEGSGLPLFWEESRSGWYRSRDWRLDPAFLSPQAPEKLQGKAESI